MEENLKRLNGETDFIELIRLLWHYKLLVILTTSLFTFSGLFWSLSISNVYTSSAILAPSSNSDSSALASQYSGLANLAGISLPSSESNRVEMGIETLKSYDFYGEFVEKNNLFIPLVAAEGWNKAEDKLLIDEDIYDERRKKWVSDIEYSVDGKPTIQFAHRKFLKKLSIETDKQTGFIKISFEHFSPNISKKVIDLLIQDINEIERKKAVSVAEKSFKYLEEELETTPSLNLKESINSLMKSQLEQIMLAKTSPDFLYKIASPAIAPEIKSGPRRSMIGIFSIFLGFFISCLVVVIRENLKK